MQKNTLHLRTTGSPMDFQAAQTLCEETVPFAEVIQAGDYLGLLKLGTESILGPICAPCLVVELTSFAQNVAAHNDPWAQATAHFILIRKYIRKDEARSFA